MSVSALPDNDNPIPPPPDTAPPRRSRRELNRPTAFAAIAVVFVLFMAASSAPSPLYVVYQQRWDFSATTLTTVFAVYVLGMIAALLVLGSLSDHLGRRPVLLSAITLEAASMALFLVADSVSLLLTARLVQGIATGAAMTALGAALADLNPAHAPHRAGVVTGAAPTFGLGLGALGCGFLVEYGPHPPGSCTCCCWRVSSWPRPWSPRCPRRRCGGPEPPARSSPASKSHPTCGRTCCAWCRSSSRAGHWAACTSRSDRRSPWACSASPVTSSAASWSPC
ncbi:MFS transporter [Streptomyces sp. NPDC017991]|uniref:MFS transporter n=1 Tax=Streptomyces sp. NPDC017991 TaxID=3365026 RepID=UPI00379E51ED